jgi:hypothetical protein
MNTAFSYQVQPQAPQTDLMFTTSHYATYPVESLPRAMREAATIMAGVAANVGIHGHRPHAEVAL